jgi:putative spermidine/putrescine transport system ATP-binding protein
MSALTHSLLLDRVGKRYGEFVAAADVTLEVGRGEFVTLLGPSGSGKTTLLMAIAGFVTPDAGRILLDGKPIDHLPPEKRNFGMVFQGYALFPHMTVGENVAFPLKVRRTPSAETRERVQRVLDLVQLSQLGDRLPRQLSGGQQQRVALARALVFAPHLLLLDEPLSALDKKLRAELQMELRDLHRRVGLTFIYVTHDQEEALALSDRIAILRGGRLVQQGSPAELYERPATRFVADFFGRSNFLRATITERGDGTFACEVGGHRVLQAGPAPAGPTALLALRPEKIAVLRDGPAPANAVEGRLAAWSYLGSAYQLEVEAGAFGRLAVSVPAWRHGPVPRAGDRVDLGWDPDAAVVIGED